MKNIFFILLIGSIANQSLAQGIHFSQFYNSPILLNPANTAMLAEDDYRAGVQYRNQYQSIPVPYNTSSAWADFTVGRNDDAKGWWGLGAAFWNDVAGDSKLKMTKAQINTAYHLALGEKNMLSFGSGFGYVNRRIDLTGLTFDNQWDEFSYNNDLPSKEKIVSGRTNYADVQIGMNFSHFDNEKIYYKVGVSALHINQPKETFLEGSNRLGIRPMIDLELSYKTSDNFIISPSAYYTVQKKGSEAVVGFTSNANLMRNSFQRGDRNELLTGVYYRLGDAIIVNSGYRWKNTTFMVSYDQTISGLAKANSGVGAIEFSIIYSTRYGNYGGERKIMGCPRF
jgi:type IX secretion system PorP/SprF family membrane protein